jgi:hypothetical protein
MEEPKSVDEVFKNIGIGGEPDPIIRSGTAQTNETVPADSKTDCSGGKKSSDECAPPVEPEPAVAAHEPPSVNPMKPAQNMPPHSGPADESQSMLQDIQTGIEQLEQEVKAISESSGKTVGEIREMHKLYHNEFASRLVSMQEELERYREIEKGRLFDGILCEIAKLYSDNESIVDEITDDKLRKRLRYMFMDILQVLEINGVFKQKSNPGEKRNTRHCQVIDRVSTDDPSLHDTVVKSRSTGFFVENRSLVKEPVDVYLFTDAAANHSTES